ncbi:MAG: hypothetical protein HYS74_02910 [Parcubacteria group bacterium]|nr:hypothetical protein [Parcubacteria group bacterium]
MILWPQAQAGGKSAMSNGLVSVFPIDSFILTFFVWLVSFMPWVERTVYGLGSTSSVSYTLWDNVALNGIPAQSILAVQTLAFSLDILRAYGRVDVKRWMLCCLTALSVAYVSCAFFLFSSASAGRAGVDVAGGIVVMLSVLVALFAVYFRRKRYIPPSS